MADYLREGERETNDFVYLLSDEKFITEEDRKRAFRVTILTGKPVNMVVRPRGIRKLFHKFLG